jgi:hypothetical protein
MRTTIRFVLLVMALVTGRSARAQDPRPRASTRHSFFVSWGYNRAQYSASRIRFNGNNYDFTLHDVTASDRAEPFTLDRYFAPRNIWIPQYNYRAGWFYSDEWSISIGLDHMKYVMDADQSVQITGSISPERSQRYAGNETHTVKLTNDFLQYEHTDGLNLLSLDVDHHDLLWRSQRGSIHINFTEGLFLGPMIPRTDVRLFNEGINNRFHVAGYGAGMQFGLFAMFPRRVFVRLLVKGGYTELPDVLTTGTSSDRASQGFWFLQESFSVGLLLGGKSH